MKIIISHNEQFASHEVRFSSKPKHWVRRLMARLGYKWIRTDRCWSRPFAGLPTLLAADQLESAIRTEHVNE